MHVVTIIIMKHTQVVLVRYLIFIRYHDIFSILDIRSIPVRQYPLSTMQCRFMKSTNNSQTLPRVY